MPYKISGTKSETARIIILKESDWSIESNTVISGSGEYEVLGVVSGTKTILSRSNSGEFLGYGGVIPVTYIPPFVAAAGGTITYDGDYKVHTFTSNDTLVVKTNGGDIEYLLIAGGGGGGSISTGGSTINSAGGGAGGYVYSALHNVSVDSFGVVIGPGGQGGVAGTRVQGTNGGNTVFAGFTAIGGGGGGSYKQNGLNGGCGGGAGSRSTSGDPYYGGIGSQGGDGEDTIPAATTGGAGGGGIGGDAPPRNYTNRGGPGGPGLQFDISGAPTYYGGGGGGGAYLGDETDVYGGIGGGGRGGYGVTEAGVAGTNGLGGGGGGSHGSNNLAGGQGGSGIVVVRYQYQ